MKLNDGAVDHTYQVVKVINLDLPVERQTRGAGADRRNGDNDIK